MTILATLQHASHKIVQSYKTDIHHDVELIEKMEENEYIVWHVYDCGSCFIWLSKDVNTPFKEDFISIEIYAITRLFNSNNCQTYLLKKVTNGIELIPICHSDLEYLQQ